MGFWKNPRVNAGTLALKLRDSRRQIKFFQRAGIIANYVDCSGCGATCTIIVFSTKQFKCSKCRRGMSVFNNTFMSGLRCSIQKVVMLSNNINLDHTTAQSVYCQVQVQSPKVKTRRTWADTKITWATTHHHTTPYFLSMKECSG